jgi:mannitol-1-/sugar-/sorbitol-6-phosphatase
VIFSCDAILFDMDGTLIDSGVCVNRQWERWAEKRGLDPATVLAVSHGRRTVETMKLLLPDEDVSADLSEFIAAETADLHDVGCIPGAAELASRVPRERWAVVTSSARPVAAARLAHTGFPSPGALITADDVERGKPHPEPWLQAATALGYAPERCLVFEDANSGIQAACAAGMQVVGVRWSRERLDCAYRIASFADVRVEIGGELCVTIPDLPPVAPRA